MPCCKKHFSTWDINPNFQIKTRLQTTWKVRNMLQNDGVFFFGGGGGDGNASEENGVRDNKTHENYSHFLSFLVTRLQLQLDG